MERCLQTKGIPAVSYCVRCEKTLSVRKRKPFVSVGRRFSMNLSKRLWEVFSYVQIRQATRLCSGFYRDLGYHQRLYVFSRRYGNQSKFDLFPDFSVGRVFRPLDRSCRRTDRRRTGANHRAARSVDSVYHDIQRIDRVYPRCFIFYT